MAPVTSFALTSTVYKKVHAFEAKRTNAKLGVRQYQLSSESVVSDLCC